MAATPKKFEIEKLIVQVLDDSSFVETLSLVRGKSSLGEAAGEGVVSGFGMIGDIQVGVFGTAHEVLQGGIGKKNAKKISYIVDNAVKIGAPVIGFVDSEGARFAEGIEAMEGYADIIESFSAAYGSVPVILVVTGSCFGMLSYLTSFCDLCIAMPAAKIASSSPLLLVANTKIDQKDIGGIKIHTEKSGLFTNTVQNPAQLRTLVLDALGFLTFDETDCADDANRVSRKLKIGSPVTDIISEVFDDKKFLPMREDFGKEVITGFARLNGKAVGIVAGNSQVNEGRITSDSACKITSFVSVCDSFDLPIINIVDCMGAINNLQDENHDLIRNVSDMLFAYNATGCCKIALITGKAVGLGYTAFANKRSVDYSVAWEGATIGMLGDTQTATLLFSDLIAQAKVADKQRVTEELATAYGKDNSAATVVAESGYLDNVISPAVTRQYLIAAVETFGRR